MGVAGPPGATERRGDLKQYGATKFYLLANKDGWVFGCPAFIPEFYSGNTYKF